MRWMVMGLLSVVVMAWPVSHVRAEEKRRASERVLEGVVSGLLGTPQQSTDAVYTAQERDRLISLLQSGDYATSRQGETIDMMVYGIPLTRIEHVYTAKPIPPSQTFNRTTGQ